MNHKEKQSITHYISIRFAAIILIMAAIMILFISYFLHLNGFIKKAAPKPEKETTVFIRHNIQQYFLHT